MCQRLLVICTAIILTQGRQNHLRQTRSKRRDGIGQFYCICFIGTSLKKHCETITIESLWVQSALDIYKTGILHLYINNYTDTLAATYTHSCHAIAGAAAMQLMYQFRHDDCTSSTYRMSKCDSTAIYIHNIRWEV